MVYFKLMFIYIVEKLKEIKKYDQIFKVISTNQMNS